MKQNWVLSGAIILWATFVWTLVMTFFLKEEIPTEYQKGILEGKRQLSLEINKDLPMLASCLLGEIKENPPR